MEEGRGWIYPRSYLRLVSVVVAFAALLTPIDATITSVSLPFIAEGVRASYLEAIWIPLGYLAAVAALLLPFGRLGDIGGRKRIMAIGFLLFSAGTAMSGLSSFGMELDAWRILQGVGGAMILANSGALISEVYPPWERGKAFGYYTMAVYIGTVLGPLLGGAIVSFPYLLGIQSWRWVFFVTLPPSALGLVLSQAKVREPTRRPAAGMDFAGAALSAPALGLIMAGMTAGSFVGWSPIYEALLAMGIVLLAAFLLVEARRGEGALLSMGMFRSLQFTAGNIAALLNYAGFYFVPFFLSYYMEKVLGLAPSYTSLVLLSIFASMVVLAPISGRLSDAIGSRGLATFGMALIAAGILLLAQLGVTATAADVAWRTLMIGIGMGLFSSPNTASVMRASRPERLGTANATLSAMRVIGQAMSLALAGSLASAYIPASTLSYMFTGIGTGIGTGAALSVSSASFVAGLRRVYVTMAALVIGGAAASAVRSEAAVEGGGRREGPSPA